MFWRFSDVFSRNPSSDIDKKPSRPSEAVSLRKRASFAVLGAMMGMSVAANSSAEKNQIHEISKQSLNSLRMDVAPDINKHLTVPKKTEENKDWDENISEKDIDPLVLKMIPTLGKSSVRDTKLPEKLYIPNASKAEKENFLNFLDNVLHVYGMDARMFANLAIQESGGKADTVSKNGKTLYGLVGISMLDIKQWYDSYKDVFGTIPLSVANTVSNMTVRNSLIAFLKDQSKKKYDAFVATLHGHHLDQYASTFAAIAIWKAKNQVVARKNQVETFKSTQKTLANISDGQLRLINTLRKNAERPPITRADIDVLRFKTLMSKEKFEMFNSLVLYNGRGAKSIPYAISIMA